MKQQNSGCGRRLWDGCCLIIAAVGISIIGPCTACSDEPKQDPVCVVRHQQESQNKICRERE